MFNLDIKNLIKEINENQNILSSLKNKLTNLNSELESKEKRNYEKFKERNEDLDFLENELKSKFDNKYFNFIKHFDFLNEKELIENIDFEVIEEIGCLTKRPESILGINDIYNVFDQDKKSITFKLREKKVINALEYSFYSEETRLPIIPRDIKISYDEYTDSFEENYFRYFNLNNQKNFISKYIFEPKPIKEIVFYFDENVNSKNFYFKLFSIKYRKNNSVKILIKNPKKISTFNISKKSNEAFLNFAFSFSENNDDFKEIKFKDNNSTFSLKNNSDFIIKIDSDDKKILNKENYAIKSKTIESVNIINEKNNYLIPVPNINIETINIIFPISSYEKLKTSFTSHNIDINNFIDSYAGVNKLKKHFIKNITESKENIVENLKFFDDEIIFKEINDAFDFYYDSKNNKIISSSFLIKYPFYINFQYKENSFNISEEYYTPMLFEFSIKG